MCRVGGVVVENGGRWGSCTQWGLESHQCPNGCRRLCCIDARAGGRNALAWPRYQAPRSLKCGCPPGWKKASTGFSRYVLHVSEINFNAAFSRPKEGSPRAPAERSSSRGVASERLARLGDVLAHGAVAFVVDDAVALRLPGAAKIAPPGRLAIVAHVPDPRQRPAASRPRVVATSKSAGNLIDALCQLCTFATKPTNRRSRVNS